jgi:hypothetical protein
MLLQAGLLGVVSIAGCTVSFPWAECNLVSGEICLELKIPLQLMLIMPTKIIVLSRGRGQVPLARNHGKAQ